MDLKLNRKKKAKVREKTQISKSMNKIDQRGKLYFQKKFKTLFISVKIHFYHLLSKLSNFIKKMNMSELSFNPFPIIETERLLLKKFEETDAQDLFLLRSNDECMKYIGKPTHKSIDESIDFIKVKNIGITEGKRIDWAIFFKPEQKIIGSISIHRIDTKNHRGEVGYMLHPTYWKQGIISEAIHEVIKFGFNTLNLHSFEALIDKNNDASIAVLTKFKFVKEAHFKENYFFNNEFIDTLVYSLLKSNYCL